MGVGYSKVFAENVIAARGSRKQEDLAQRMRTLGFKWVRQTVSEVEAGRRRVTTEEIVGLALALETTIPALTSPGDQYDEIELPNGQPIGAVSIERLAGRGVNDRAVQWRGHHDAASYTVMRRLPGVDPFDRELLSQPHWTPVPPVVAAIVTSPLGVLVGHRNDEKPPWTFLAGEAEPGEQPEDTAIREVKEEAGLRITAGEVIGERVHPKTGRTMIYMAARPTHGTEVFVGDSEELAEVRWVSLAEADELMASYGMFEPVHEYLERTLGR